MHSFISHLHPTSSNSISVWCTNRLFLLFKGIEFSLSHSKLLSGSFCVYFHFHIPVFCALGHKRPTLNIYYSKGAKATACAISVVGPQCTLSVDQLVPLFLRVVSSLHAMYYRQTFSK